MDQGITLFDNLEQNNLKVISIHTGKTICLVVKTNKIDILTDIAHFSNNVVDIISTPGGLYHYLFVTE